MPPDVQPERHHARTRNTQKGSARQGQAQGSEHPSGGVHPRGDSPRSGGKAWGAVAATSHRNRLVQSSAGGRRPASSSGRQNIWGDASESAPRVRACRGCTPAPEGIAEAQGCVSGCTEARGQGRSVAGRALAADSQGRVAATTFRAVGGGPEGGTNEGARAPDGCGEEGGPFFHEPPWPRRKPGQRAVHETEPYPEPQVVESA